MTLYNDININKNINYKNIKNYIFKNITSDNVDKNVNEIILNIYLINIILYIEYDNDYKIIQKYIYNTEEYIINKLKSYLLYLLVEHDRKIYFEKTHKDIIKLFNEKNIFDDEISKIILKYINNDNVKNYIYNINDNNNDYYDNNYIFVLKQLYHNNNYDKENKILEVEFNLVKKENIDN